jgi:hypothetical protein
MPSLSALFTHWVAKPALFLSGASLLLLLFLMNSEQIAISGVLRTEGNEEVGDAMMIVELNGESCIYNLYKENGRFKFELPVDVKARVFFEKPGYMTKEVLVDTRYAQRSRKATEENKKVKFEVVLEPVGKHGTKVYAGPVGRIGFAKGTGFMQVRYDLQLKEAEPLVQLP